MIATIRGWEMVCPEPMGRALSAYASSRSPGRTYSSRGTAAIAVSTASSRTPPARSRSIISAAVCTTLVVPLGRDRLPRRAPEHGPPRYSGR